MRPYAASRRGVDPPEDPEAWLGGLLHPGRKPCKPLKFDDRPPPAVAPLPAPLRHGLVYVRVPKTGSTTLSGVVRRIAHRRGMTHAHDGNNWLNCDELVAGESKTPAVSTQHAPRVNITGAAARRMPGAFYVTALRDPAARCLSQFYFHVTRLALEPTTARKIAFMRRACGGGYQHVFARPAPGATARATVASYDFVAVTERFDESLVVLARRLGVGLGDVLYLWGRKSGSSVNTSTGRRLLEHPPLGEEPQSVQQVARAIFGDRPDVQLLEAANLALDGARSDYGPRFWGDLAEFKRMLAVVAAKCAHRHDEDGCFINEVGCGQPCIDSALTDCLSG